jgi:hypothetical protein
MLLIIFLLFVCKWIKNDSTLHNGISLMIDAKYKNNSRACQRKKETIFCATFVEMSGKFLLVPAIYNEPSRPSATGALQCRQRCAPRKSGLPQEGQWYRSHTERAHSTLPFSSPNWATFSRHIGIVFFITRFPVAKPKFSIISQGHSVH